jgi:hypothetical protein
MKHTSDKKDEMIVKEVDFGFKSVISESNINGSLKESLYAADVLFVPIKGFREINEPLFPQGTESLFAFVREKLSPNVSVDICVEDDQYKELALHSDLINLGIILVSQVITPTFVNVLSEYINGKIALKRSNNPAIKVDIIIDKKEGKSTQITYEGEPEHFSKVIEEVKRLEQ